MYSDYELTWYNQLIDALFILIVMIMIMVPQKSLDCIKSNYKGMINKLIGVHSFKPLSVAIFVCRIH